MDARVDRRSSAAARCVVGATQVPKEFLEVSASVSPAGDLTASRSVGRLQRWRATYLRVAPGLIASISALMGLLTLLDVFWVSQRVRIHTLTRVIPIPASAAAAAVGAVSGFLLLRVAAGLRKRKRVAWQIAVGAAFVMTVAHVVRGFRPGEAVISLLLLLMLLTARSRFTARSDAHSRWFAARMFLQIVGVALVGGLIMLYASHQVSGRPSVWMRTEEVLAGLIGVDGPVRFHGDRFGDVFHGTLLAFGLFTVATVALLALRPQEPIAALSDADESRLRALLGKFGDRDSLGYFALRRDKSVLWSPSGKAALTYRVVHGVALVSGDPIGDPEAWPGVIATYRRICDEYGWTMAVMGCSETGAMIFKREAGLSTLALGDEAILEVADFTLDGRAMRGVRQACTRVARAGYRVDVRRVRDVSAEELAALNRLAEAWRGDAVERGYSMALSRLGDPADGDCVIAVARRDGQPHGVLHFVPWGRCGLSLDLMRRERDADNGLNEFMIAKVVEAAPQLGISRISLNFAVFRDAIERGERLGAGPILRSWRALLIFLSRWWQIETLYRFNVKFRPYWEPRFISFPATRDLPRIAVAALEAEAFLVRPKRVKRLLGRP
jgi:lysyl-tRNA synthetase, class II